jgi:isocitrate dehydrogenase
MEQGSDKICIARGDGIGPELMDATLRVLDAAGARLVLREIQLGEQVYRRGITSGIAEEAWAAILEHPILLKGPITTPQGGGVKSLNVTLRKTLGLFANVRPCQAWAPFVPTLHPAMDLVIVRENEEDLYAGIEHRQTAEVTQCLKLITQPGSERVIRYAFAWARLHGRRRVTCMTKDNIMKLTDGLFRRTFDAVAQDYPELETEHLIIDIGSARVATRPERFEVIVTPNLYGDILSDIAAEVAGSVGLGASANVGAGGAMFEAIHGSAPDIAGKNIANPSGLLLAAVMMLRHLGQSEVAQRIDDAWRCTLESGIHTADLAQPHTRHPVGTDAFADAVIARLGETPSHLKPAPTSTGALAACVQPLQPPPRPQKTLLGVDVFLDWDDDPRDPQHLGRRLADLGTDALQLKMITNRGVQVWPRGLPQTICTDHWRCRFLSPQGDAVSHAAILALLARLEAAGLDFIKTEHLCAFDGVPGFSLGQGQ